MPKTNSGPYYVVAVYAINEEKWTAIKSTVVAEYPTEADAQHESDRRDALNDGRCYFVASADELEPTHR